MYKLWVWSELKACVKIHQGMSCAMNYKEPSTKVKSINSSVTLCHFWPIIFCNPSTRKNREQQFICGIRAQTTAGPTIYTKPGCKNFTIHADVRDLFQLFVQTVFAAPPGGWFRTNIRFTGGLRWLYGDKYPTYVRNYGRQLMASGT
jgi:hypothetical protein